MSETLKDFNKRVTRLADWQLRIRARYEPMNGFAETAGVMHEMLAYIVSLEHQLNTTPQTKPLSDEEIPVFGILHKAQSVPLGSAIWETDAEYEKLKKIVITSVKWAIEER